MVSDRVPPPGVYGGYQPRQVTPSEMAAALIRDLKALRGENRDPYPGEWFRLARRLVVARGFARTGKLPLGRPPRGGSAVHRPPPPSPTRIRA